MGPKQLKLRTVFVFFGAFSLLTTAAAGDGLRLNRCQTDMSACQLSHKTKSNNATSHQLAMERYHFVKQLKPKFGIFPLYQSLDVNFRILFPRGRADRVYILAEGTEAFPAPRFYRDADLALFCFQEKEMRAKLVYRVLLQSARSKPHLPMTSLMDFLNTYPIGTLDGPSGEVYLSFAVLGKISHATQQDLEGQRNYVLYDVDPLDNLRVMLLSHIKDDQSPINEQTAYYDLIPKDFFSKNGLPLAIGELQPSVTK